LLPTVEKRIIEDQMKLGGDRSGGTIETQANEQLGESNKDPLATSGCPFWYLDASLLKLGFQNKCWATPDVAIREKRAASLGAVTPDFNGRKTSFQGGYTVI
jgi:hypothetical protein